MKSEGLHAWFHHNGKIKGWIDCKRSSKKKLVACGRKKGEKRKGYPACRPTLGKCNGAGKRKKKSSKRISWKKGTRAKR